MSRECFKPKKFSYGAEVQIATANEIIERYQEQDLKLTLRQLYYQFVAHHDLPNTQKSYKNLGKVISDARLAGLIDWDAIEDRGRTPDVPSQWNSIEHLVDIATRQFRLPRWAEQPHYVELWVEKQALAGVLEPVAHKHHVTLMVNKGYASSSSMYESAQRFLRAVTETEEATDRQTTILYLGDHDPSGEDMVRDIRERMDMFCGFEVYVEKIALTMEQVRQYDPPPNPAKVSDPRAVEYIRKYGDDSWEVDALDPAVLVQLIEEAIEQRTDPILLSRVIKHEDEQKAKLRKALAKVQW